MIKSIDLKYGIAFGFVGFAITLVIIYLATGTLDLRFPAVIGAGFFGGGIIASIIRRLYKEGEERKANVIFLAVILVVSTPIIAKYTYDLLVGNWNIWKFIYILAGAYLISYGVFRVKFGCGKMRCGKKVENIRRK